MGNAAVKPVELEAHEPHFKVIHLVWGIVTALGLLAFTVGRQVMTKDEAQAAFVSREVYQRDQAYIEAQMTSANGKLSRMEDKIDRLTEVLHARP